MAALSKRDIEMIFRAETGAATRPVKELSSDVKGLRQTLEDLAKSTNKTDKSLEDLAATTRGLEKAQEELASARSLLTQLNSQASALEKAEAAAAKAQTRYDGLKAQMDATEKPTKRLTNQLDSAANAVSANNAKLEQARAQYTEVKQSIESIIGPVDSLQGAFRTVAVTQREISEGLAIAKDSMSSFRTEIAQTKKEAGSGDLFGAMAAKSPLSSDAIAQISQYENRVELLRLEEQALEAQRKGDAAAEAARKQKQRDDIETLLAGNAKLDAEINDVVAASQRLEAVDAYRKLATDAIAAESAAERIAGANARAAASAGSLSDSIRGLVNPAQAAAQTLDGMDARLENVVKQLSGGKITTAQWGVLNNELQGIQATLVRVSAEIDTFNNQQAKVNSASAAYDAQAAKVRALAEAEITATTNVKELTQQLQQEEAVLDRLGGSLDRETAKLNELGAALKKAGVDSNNLPAAIQRIEASATKAAPAIQKVANVITPGGKKGFLGLNPYEMQNLSYQINDVFTSLGSGAPPMQVLAQQGGQILQIFPGIGAAVLANLPLVLALAAAFGTLAISISESNEQLATLKEGQVLIARLGETNGATAESFVQVTNRLKEFGASAEDARKAAAVLIESGMQPKAFDDLSIAVTNLASVTGTDLKTAMTEVTTAFSGGADEVLKLDDKYHFLTDTQRDQILASKDTKTETEEVNKAFTALFQKMQDGANAQRTEYTDAVNTLHGAWEDFKTSLADTGFVTAITSALAEVIRSAQHALNSLTVLRNYNQQQMQATGWTWWLGNRALPQKSMAELDSEARAMTFRQRLDAEDRFNAGRTSSGDIGLGSRGRQKQDEEQAKKDRKERERQAKKDAREREAEAKRRQREAEALERQYQNEQDQLQAGLSRVTAEALKGTSAPLEQQLANARAAVDEQFKALEDRLQEFGAKFGKSKLINGVSQEDYAKSLAAQKEQIKLNRELGVYESNINDLMKERDTKLKAIQEQQRAGFITAQQALDQTKAVLDDSGPKLDAAITAARNFIAAMTPSPETQAMLAKLDRIQAQNGSTGRSTIEADSAKAGIAQNEKAINDILERRNALIDAANKLYELGVINYTEKEQRIKDAFKGTQVELQTLIQTYSAFLDKMRAEGLIPEEVYQREKAKIDEVAAGMKHVDEVTAAVKSTAEQAIANGLMNMFDTFAQGIANIITGAGSLKDLFSDLGRAALNFAAEFMKAIAQAILQIYALRIAKSLVGGFHGGGTVGDYGAGQMKLNRNIGVPDLNLSAVPRYHNGTEGAGLKHDEMLAVLQKGEKVQTEEQQRLEANRIAALKKGRNGSGLKQVLAFGDDQIAGAMAGPAGESVTVTHIKRNIPLLKQLLR